MPRPTATMVTRCLPQLALKLPGAPRIVRLFYFPISDAVAREERRLTSHGYLGLFLQCKTLLDYSSLILTTIKPTKTGY